MARVIKTTHPGINSFVFLTPEEAAREFGGGFSLIGSPRPPQPPPLPPVVTPPKTPKKKKGGK